MRQWIAFLLLAVATLLFFLLAIKTEWGGDNKQAWAFVALAGGLMVAHLPADGPWRRGPA